MSIFRIKFDDMETGDQKTVVTVVEAAGGIAAHEWAEDLAYSMADKAPYEIECLDSEVQELYDEGSTVSELATKYRLSRDAIRKVVQK